jgi:hypothetical protein
MRARTLSCSLACARAAPLRQTGGACCGGELQRKRASRIAAEARPARRQLRAHARAHTPPPTQSLTPTLALTPHARACPLPHALSASRRARQLSGLRDALPCHWGSAVAVRVDAGRADLLRACVLGADGTPYAHGAFLFDILLPPAYPDACVHACMRACEAVPAAALSTHRSTKMCAF